MEITRGNVEDTLSVASRLDVTSLYMKEAFPFLEKRYDQNVLKSACG
jgi:hypothetical protein